MAFIYSWIPAYQQIVAKLPAYRNRQPELIQLLRDIGVNVNEDEEVRDIKSPLTEIDPFTFLFFLAKTRNDWNKVKIIRKLCDLWKIDLLVNDVCGIPGPNAQKLWMFPYQYERTNEIASLWDFFESALAGTITDVQFATIRKIKSVEIQKMTEGLFMVDPDSYLCLNGKVKPYLQSFDINTEFESYTQLEILYAEIKTKIRYSFHEISFKGYIDTTTKDHVPSFFRIGTKEGESGESQLTDMITNDIASIGWSDTGDLNEIEPLNKGVIMKAFTDAGYESAKNVASRKAGEIMVFKNEIVAGDYVCAADGATIKAIGKVVSNHYVFDDNLTFAHCRCVEWIKTDIEDLSINEGLRTSVWKYYEANSIKAIKDYLNLLPKTDNTPREHNYDKNNIQNYSGNMSLNQILYGPPGTGKTFHSISHAVAIIDNRDVKDVISQREQEAQADGIQSNTILDRLKEHMAGDRIKFCTFHQSMSYEDFIEGIKPEEPKDRDQYLKYKVKPGIFKEFCDLIKIQNDIDGGNQTSPLPPTTPTTMPPTVMALPPVSSAPFSFSAQYDAFINSFIGQTKNEKNWTKNNEDAYELPKIPAAKDQDVSYRIVAATETYITLADKNTEAIKFTKKRLISISNKYPGASVDSIQHGPVKMGIGFESGDVSKLIALIKYIRTVNISAVSNLTGNKRVHVPNTETNSYKDYPYVLIIDEINRGNVSQIFGELITLIEDDKRAGEKEALTVTLPYSRQEFDVPSNLYIIGTMNTADKSVEALDSALRRRFTFVPMMPEEDKLPTNVDDINLNLLLEKLNERLRILKDNDHTIGHAWLMGVKNIEDLRVAFGNKILPLLQEYFYNDYEKLGLVIGDRFFADISQASSSRLKNFSGGNGVAGQYDQAWQYKLKLASKLTKEDFQSLY